jgi:hypothetical protein
LIWLRIKLHDLFYLLFIRFSWSHNLRINYKLKEKGVLLYLFSQNTINWNSALLCFFFFFISFHFFSINIFFLISSFNIIFFFYLVSHSNDTDLRFDELIWFDELNWFGGLTWLPQIFFSILSFNIDLIEN